MTERNVLITSLDSMENRSEHRFFYIKEGRKTSYCDAIGVAEAGTKYILSRESIDEIIVLGTGATYKEGDELKHMQLRDFDGYGGEDTEALSEYSFYRYRIAQFLDDLDFEGGDVYGDIDPQHREELIDIYHRFADSTLKDIQQDENRRERMFHLLTTDRNRFEKLLSMLPEETQEEDLKWLHWYLFDRLDSDFKLRELDENDDIEICFVPTTKRRVGKIPIENIREIMEAVYHSGADRINLYMDMQGIGSNAGNLLIQILSMLSDFDESRLEIREIITTQYDPGSFASPIDNNGLHAYNLRHLVAGMSAFIQFGKVDTLKEYWESQHIRDQHIEKLLYGMKCVDDGISLCQIGDLEYGIKVLKKVFDETSKEDLNELENLVFVMIEEVIRADYGELLADSNWIDSLALIKWAYRKHFYQQVLTIIESRIPSDLVFKGILYYADDEESKAAAMEEFCRLYYASPGNMRYSFDDLDHYFIKYYGRDKVNHRQSAEQRNNEYAALRAECVTHGHEGMIREKSRLAGKPELLREVLEAYYAIAPLRNMINHAMSRRRDLDLDNINVDEENERLAMLNNAITRFINAYEAALEAREPGEKPVRIRSGEFRDYTKANMPERRDDNRSGRGFRDRAENRLERRNDNSPENGQDNAADNGSGTGSDNADNN
jgi:hypothetical protein